MNNPYHSGFPDPENAYPDITICIPTHGRTSLLRHSVYSALQQDYPGKFSILILNDCPEQELVCDHPIVRIVKERHRTSLGEKRNRMMELIDTQWMAWLDDDDLIRPDHLRKIHHLVNRPEPCVTSKHTLWFNGDKGEITGPSCADLIMRGSAARSIGHPSTGTDEWVFLFNMKERFGIYESPSRIPTYIHCWGNSSFHVTGTGNLNNDTAPYREDVVRRLREGSEPSGVVEIIPTKDPHDLVAKSQTLINDWVVPYGS